MAAGADINRRAKLDGETPLHFAMRAFFHGRFHRVKVTALVQALIAHGAELELASSAKKKITPLALAAALHRRRRARRPAGGSDRLTPRTACRTNGYNPR